MQGAGSSEYKDASLMQKIVNDLPANLMRKTLSGNLNFFFSDVNCTQVRMCVYGRYAPATTPPALDYPVLKSKIT